MAALPTLESAPLAPGGWRPVLDATADPAPRLLRVPSVTDREHEVLRWVAAGKTDRDIADILGISHRTVHKHLQSAYAKLGVETRTAAVMRLVAALEDDAGGSRRAAAKRLSPYPAARKAAAVTASDG